MNLFVTCDLWVAVSNESWADPSTFFHLNLYFHLMLKCFQLAPFLWILVLLLFAFNHMLIGLIHFPHCPLASTLPNPGPMDSGQMYAPNIVAHTLMASLAFNDPRQWWALSQEVMIRSSRVRIRHMVRNRNSNILLVAYLVLWRVQSFWTVFSTELILIWAVKIWNDYISRVWWFKDPSPKAD